MNKLLGLSVFIAASIALSATNLFAVHAQSAPPRLEIVVPAYFYPATGDPNWPALTNAASRAPVTAILNPGSGPGAAPDTNYQAVASAFKAAGGKLIGYIHTSYTNRPIADVVADMERYVAWYPVDGFFIDEMSNQDTPAHLTYYSNVYNYAKNLSPASGAPFRVIGNPGTNTAPNYLSFPVADALLIHEGTKRDYKNFETPQWVLDMPSHRFGHLVYKAGKARAMRKTIRKAVGRNAGLIYVTDDRLPNPWDSLPSYWDAQVDCVVAINQGAERC